MTVAAAAEQTRSVSRVIAAEFRAEIARQGRSTRQVARESGLGEMWLSRRLGKNANTDLTLEEVEQIAGLIGIPMERILTVWLDATRGASPSANAPHTLPRLDSNQQPSGYQSDSNVLPFVRRRAGLPRPARLRRVV